KHRLLHSFELKNKFLVSTFAISMNSKVQKIIQEVNQGKISPIYVLDGDENYYLDLLTHYFEHNLMPDDQKDFNQTVIYGKDVSANDIINACLRYPMFAERQLIIVKDAAQIKDFNNLQSYIEKPMSTTVLVLEHRGKKLDARSKITKTIQSKA